MCAAPLYILLVDIGQIRNNIRSNPPPRIRNCDCNLMTSVIFMRLIQ